MSTGGLRILSRAQALSDEKSELLRHLVQDWPGQPFDDFGLIRVVNRNGSRPPLLWCFNAAHELPAMAAHLDPDQPIIALRSLNLVEPLDDARLGKDEALADFYTGLLLSYPRLDECTIGGNCQGASIAVRLAANFCLAGRHVRMLITMETQSSYPFPGRVGLIFGEKSDNFNPFLRGECPQQKWDTLFAQWEVQIVPGGHGEYFSVENAPGLCRAVSDYLRVPAYNSNQVKATRQGRVSVQWSEEGFRMKAGSTTPVSVYVDFDAMTAGENLVLCVVWKSLKQGIRDKNERFTIPALAWGTELIPLSLNAPQEPGIWDLYIFACRDRQGPVSWAENYDPVNWIVVE